MLCMCRCQITHGKVRGHLESWSSSSTLWRQDLFWLATAYSGHLALKLLGSSGLLPSSWRYSGITDAHYCAWLCENHGDPNSEPRVCKQGLFPTELSLQLLKKMCFSVCACVCIIMCELSCHRVHMEVRGQLLVAVLTFHFIWDRVSVILLLCTLGLLVHEFLVVFLSLPPISL